MNFIKKIYLRLVKGIEIYGSKNLTISDTAWLSNRSIVNASNGKIVLGKNTRIGNSTELVAAQGHEIHLKDYSTIYSNGKLLGGITIERYCVLATNIYMSSGNHFAFEYPELPIRMQDILVRKEKKNINKPIHIHEDVWIGNGVFISPGITIGRGAIIGAGAIVTKDVAPYKVVVGNPGKTIKERLHFEPPSSLNGKNQKHSPYFYQGFDHLLPLESRKEKGMELLDRGIIKITPVSKIITISGSSTRKEKVQIGINDQTELHDIEPGNFIISIELKTTMVNESIIDLNLSAKNNAQGLFIHSVTT